MWKCWVQGAEAYITGRLFESEAKISLHSTGECQWSRTDTWVQRDPNRRNADRHIAKWKVVYPQDNTAFLAFRVAVPVSELRPEPVQSGQKRAFWIGNAPADSTVEFCFYFTRELDGPPVTNSNPALRHLASLRLRDGRWLVTFVWLRSLSAVDVIAARGAAVTQAREAGVQVRPGHRIALFAPPTAAHRRRYSRSVRPTSNQSLHPTWQQNGRSLCLSVFFVACPAHMTFWDYFLA